MRAYITMQKLQFPWNCCVLILSLVRALCKLSFAAGVRPVRRNQWSDDVHFKNSIQKSMLAHDAVAAAVLHKHHSIIRVDAGFIQFGHGLAHGAGPTKNSIFAIFRASYFFLRYKRFVIRIFLCIGDFRRFLKQKKELSRLNSNFQKKYGVEPAHRHSQQFFFENEDYSTKNRNSLTM